MLAVLDTNYFINRKQIEKDFTVGYITPQIYNELKDKESRRIFDTLSYKINIRNPQPQFIIEVVEKIKNLELSEADISIVALCLEIKNEQFDVWIEEKKEFTCFTDDNGVLNALRYFGIYVNGDNDMKLYKYRCYACYQIYDNKVDFCKICGYPTITRVTVSKDANGNETIHLKKKFVHRQKVLKDENGTVIKSEDQKEYGIYCKNKKKAEKRFLNSIKGARNI